MLFTERTLDANSSAALDVVGTDNIAVDMTEMVYTPSVTEADTVPGSIASAVNIAVGGSVDVIIETLGDHDWYRVSLVAGVTYTFQTSNDSSGTDAFLNLRDASGVLISSDDDAGDGNNSLITFTATTTGDYFIDAGTYADQTTGSYHLFVASQNGEAEPNNSVATAQSLALGGSISGQVNASGDHDFYAVNLVAGQTYVFRTAATAATDTTDTTLTLRNAAGTQLLTNDDAGEAGFSAIRYTATATGTFYLDVAGFGTTTGAYNITAFTAPTPVVYTNDQIANQLTNGYWGGGSHHFNVAPGGSLTYNITALTLDGQTLARAALALWSDVTGITFNEVTVGGQLVYDDNQTGAFANSSYSNGIISSSTINVGTAWIATYGTGLNTYSFQTYIHETGHALGLGHAGNYNGSADYSSDSLYLNDSWATTIMSYFDQTENTYFQAQGFTRQFVETPMLADGIAMAALYGANTLTRTGDTTYGFNNTSGRDIYNATLYPSIGYTIYDNGGIDTLDYSGFGNNQLINLNAEAFSNIGARVGNVSIARGSVIENAIGGSGNDVIIGNSADNTLIGGLGNDTLSGGAGNDTLHGSGGLDQLNGEAGNDTLVATTSGSSIDGGADFDTLLAVELVSLVAAANMEAIQLAGGGPVLTLTGSQLSNGFATNTTLTGHGSIVVNMDPGVLLSATAMAVQPGSAITMTINGTAGTDLIKASLTATNIINGGDSGDQIRAGNLADTINGGNGTDKMMGLGGADTLTGGAGNDQFRYIQGSDSGLGAASDHITDFVPGSDKLDFRLLDVDSVAPGIQGLTYIDTQAFHATGAAEVRYGVSGVNLMVEVDLNGDGVADMQIVLDNDSALSLSSGDFLL